MNELELRHRVGEILAEEDKPIVDWAKVQTMCMALVDVLNLNETPCPNAVYHFVDDADVRRRDARYGRHQRELVRRYVLNGEMVEHAPSVRVSLWAVIPVLLVVVLLIWWPFR